MNGSPPGKRALFCPLPPALSSCRGQDLLERQPPVEEAGQGLSKDKEPFGVLTGGQVGRLAVCVSV